MSLPFRCHREKLVRLFSVLLCAVVIALAMPNPARAWHDDDWRPRQSHEHPRGSWGPPWFVAAPFGVRIYPGYYPAPIYSPPYYPGPPAYVQAPPAVSFGFVFRR